MASPTENAEQILRINTFLLQARRNAVDNEVLGQALANISEALIQLSVGMRATYREVEELKKTMMQAGRKV